MSLTRIDRNQVSYFFDPKMPPVATAEVGDRVVFHTRDCFNDELLKETDLATSIDMSRMNPCTGPLSVKGASAGSVLAVRIEDIRLRDWGVLTLIPKEGVLDEYVSGPVTRIVRIRQDAGFVEFAENIRLGLRPHVGTIGTTPAMRYPTGRTGNHGGNMDIRFAGPGTTLYFPVFVDGGLLMMGDVHANMGDGEICIGVETGAEVTVKIEGIYRNVSLPAPVLETQTHWMTYADAPNGKDGIKEVCRRMAEFLCSRTGVSNEDATLLISTSGDVKVAQWAEAGYNYTFYLEFPKAVFVDGSLASFAANS